MSRFLIQTDLHDEFWQELTWPDRRMLIKEEVDAILLAGDLSTKGRTLDVMLDAWKKTGLPGAPRSMAITTSTMRASPSAAKSTSCAWRACGLMALTSTSSSARPR